MRKFCAMVIGIALLLGGTITPTIAATPFSSSVKKEALVETCLELMLGQKIGKSGGAKFELPEAPVIEGKHSLAPVRSIANKLGGKVDYDKKTKQVTLTFGQIVIEMQVGKTECYVNGVRDLMSLAPQQKGKNGTVFVPVSFLSEVLGLETDLLPNGKILIRGKWKHGHDDKPSEPKQLIDVAYKVLPKPALKTEWLEASLNKPTLLYGLAANLLEQPSAAALSRNVLVVACGWQGSTGYDIEVQSINVVDGELVVRVRLVNPAQGSFQASVMRYVYQVLLLPEGLPQINGWRLEASDGMLLNAQQLSLQVPYQLASEADVQWANLDEAGVAVKPITGEKLLVVIKRGLVPSTGYGISLQALEQKAWGEIVARVAYSDPAANLFQNTVICSPYVAFYVDPVYYGHDFRAILSDYSSGQLVAVPGTLKSNIDRSQRRLFTGYGRDLLVNPGIWADQLLLVAMRGYCPTGGYSIAIESLVRGDGDNVYVKVGEDDPAPGAMVTMAITYPYHIVQVPNELTKCDFQYLPK